MNHILVYDKKIHMKIKNLKYIKKKLKIKK